jgi:hypothetical protein
MFRPLVWGVTRGPRPSKLYSKDKVLELRAQRPAQHGQLVPSRKAAHARL